MKKRKWLVLISGLVYFAIIPIVAFFNNPNCINVFSKGWNQPGWRVQQKVVLLVWGCSVPLTGIVSFICFWVVRRCFRKTGNSFIRKKSWKGAIVRIGCMILCVGIVLSSLVWVVVGALPCTNINDISPAMGARIKIASCFEIDEVIKFFTISVDDLIQIGPENLSDNLQNEEFFFYHYLSRSEDKKYDDFSISNLSIIKERFRLYYMTGFDIMANVEFLYTEQKITIYNTFIFACLEIPQYAMALYDTDVGYIVAIEDVHRKYDDQSFCGMIYFTYEDFVKYSKRDQELIWEEVNSWEESMFGGPSQMMENPINYNPLNVVKIEKKRWNNSHEAILYIIACAILHVALVCAIWYGGYRLYQKKRRSTPPADPNTEEAPQSGTE